MSPHRRLAAVAMVACVSLPGVACSDDTPPTSGTTTTTRPRFGAGLDRPEGPREPEPELTMAAVSTRPEMVTGGDVLVEITIPEGVAPDDLAVQRGDDDITEAFAGTGRVRTALVTGLELGPNVLRAEVGDMEATLEVTDHPTTGPVFSGPHLPLFACSTEAAGLEPSTPPDCTAPTVVDHRYITTAGAMADLPDPAARPADLAYAVIDGRRVPLIVRRERGVINRGTYTVAVVDPTTTDADPGPATAPSTTRPAATEPATTAPPDDVEPAWNGRLVWRFGGGCGTTYSQGSDGAPAEDPALLARGYAVASSSFTTFQTHCNDVVAAETVMMVTEHISETLGPPEATIGQGSSGGSIQQHLIVQNYPGLLDAAATGEPFPDAVSVSSGVTDCALLGRYYATPVGSALTPLQRTVINGHATTDTCDNWTASFLEALRPTDGCPAVPDDVRYDADVRRGGLRCTLQDANVASLGIDPLSGFANRPLDNVGVQYGLNALNAGALTVDQFLDLNASIGGFDVDGGFSPVRTVSSPETIATAYAGGRVAVGSGDLRVVPIIDVDTFTDLGGDIHDRFRAFALRDRLRLPDGRPAPNHLIWTRQPTDGPLPATGAVPVGADVMTQAVVALDSWLKAIEADEEGGNRAEIVARSRPEQVTDECLDPAGRPVRGPEVYEAGGGCVAPFPISGDPRTAAGERRADDVLKCRLTPVDPAAFGPTLTTEQTARLRRTFPLGVCDWTARGSGQLDPSDTWQSYADGLPFDPVRLLELERQREVTGREDEVADDEGG